MNVKMEGFLPKIAPVPASRPAAPQRKTEVGRTDSFREVLHREISKDTLKLSAHAQKRLQERKIALSDADLQKIGRAVEQAAAKGVKDSLIIYGDLTLVTSVKNRTVVTALDSDAAAGRLFTKIDGAIIIK
ncbi:MAG: TIGR02530 family flagellar biosynthesis protein [Bacillota bacterium]